MSNTSFNDSFFDAGSSPEKQANGNSEAGPASLEETLRQELLEKSSLQWPQKYGNTEYKVLTEIEQTYRGWRFKSYATVNGRKADPMDYPEELEETRGESRSKDDEPSSIFLNRVIRKHLEKCDAVKAIIDDQKAEEYRKRRRKMMIIGGLLAVLVLVVGGGYAWYVWPRDAGVAQVVGVGESFVYHLPVEADTIVKASSELPAWLHFDEQSLTLSGIPPEQENGESYDLTFLVHGKALKLFALERKIVVKLTVGLAAKPLVLGLNYSSIKGIQREGANGIPVIELQGSDVITVEVIDKQTGKVLLQEVINIRLVP